MYVLSCIQSELCQSVENSFLVVRILLTIANSLFETKLLKAFGDDISNLNEARFCLFKLSWFAMEPAKTASNSITEPGLERAP